MPDGQFNGAISWYHLMAPFYGMCVPGLSINKLVEQSGEFANIKCSVTGE